MENDTKKSIEIEEIFHPLNNIQPLRILVEGQPGFGKTTLATKLVHDWAMGKKYIDSFKFTFFIPLRELHNRSIKEVLEQIARRFNVSDISDIVNLHEKNTLFLFDGLDEISREDRREIVRILYKQIYCYATVIAFCRTGLFALDRDEREQFFAQTNVRQNFQCKLVRTLGVKRDKKKQGIRKLTGWNFIDTVLSRILPKRSKMTRLQTKIQFLEKFLGRPIEDNIIQSLSWEIWEMFDSPLLLTLLAVIIEKDGHIDDFSTKTVFYEKLFNSIVKHSSVKLGNEISHDFNLFRMDSSIDPIRDSMRQFGRLSARKIMKNDLKFDSDDLTKQIYELGFLMIHKEILYDSAKSHFEALHYSIMEFAAAFALWVDLKSECASIEDNLKLVMHHFLESNGTSLVLPFLACLMDDELDLLLGHIDSFAAWFCLDINLTVKFLSDCLSSNISKSKYLRTFIPSSVDCIEINDDNLKVKDLLIYGSECGKIEHITITKYTDSKIFTNEIQSFFEVKITREYSILFTISGKIQLLSNSIPFDRPLNEVLLFAATSNCQSCALSLSNPSDIAEFCELIMKEKILSKLKYHYLKIKAELEYKYKQVLIMKLAEVLTKLLENDQVQYLCLSLLSHHEKMFDFTEFTHAAAQSKYLTCLHLCGLTIDLDELTNSGNKNYTYMSFVQCRLICGRPSLLKNCCQHLRCDDVEFVQPDASINHLTKSYLAWNVVALSDKLYRNSNFPDYACWKNLQTLHLRMSLGIDPNKLANCIFTLPITNLAITSEYNDDESTSNLFKCMNNLWAVSNDTSQLKTILLTEFILNKSSRFDLMEGVVRHHWDKVYFVAPNVHNFRVFMESPCYSNVRLTHVDYQSILLELGLFTVDFPLFVYDGHFSYQQYKVLSVSPK
uniref:NACHT domain-containing protein n=1 Tax=Strigamia maritima TaxID=126957 RepID=T1IHR1_STRMM